MIRLTRPSIDEADLAAVRDVIASGQLVQGPRVAEFERLVGGYVGARHAIAVTNCTSALQMALIALDVGPGDIVVVPPYSWPATANVVELCGARPVFADIDPGTFNMRPDALEEVLAEIFRSSDSAKRVKAIIPVHTFGQIADMPELMAIADRCGIPVVEDAACALGASLDGKQAGSWGKIGCFSFHPRKAITTGEGGVIVTDDDSIARRLRALRNHGQDADSLTPDFILPGFNNRMTEFQAAFGATQMAKLDRVIAARRACAARYDQILDPALKRCGARSADERHVFQSYVVLLPREHAKARAEYIAACRRAGVEAQIGTWHIPLIRYYRERYGYRPGAFPVCDDIAERTVTLPLFEGMTDQELEMVAHQVQRALSDLAAADVATADA